LVLLLIQAIYNESTRDREFHFFDSGAAGHIVRNGQCIGACDGRAQFDASHFANTGNDAEAQECFGD
jgi:hypothetical protein